MLSRRRNRRSIPKVLPVRKLNKKRNEDVEERLQGWVEEAGKKRLGSISAHQTSVVYKIKTKLMKVLKIKIQNYHIFACRTSQRN